MARVKRALTPPIAWYGGKVRMVRKLLPLVPPHHTYVEVFGGAASMLMAKPPSPVEVYNDVDSALVTLYRVIRCPKRFPEFHKLVSLTPYSREEFYDALSAIGESGDTGNDVGIAYRFFIAVRMGFSAKVGGSWSYRITASNNGMAAGVAQYLSAIERLPEIHKRLSRVQIENDDFRRIIRRYDGSGTFFYLDPPYVPSTRRQSNVYRHEMSERDHHELVDMLKAIEGKAMLSGYDNAIYRHLEEAGWNRVEFSVLVSAPLAKTAKSEKERTEVVWMNYEVQRSMTCSDERAESSI